MQRKELVCLLNPDLNSTPMDRKFGDEEELTMEQCLERMMQANKYLWKNLGRDEEDSMMADQHVYDPSHAADQFSYNAWDCTVYDPPTSSYSYQESPNYGGSINGDSREVWPTYTQLEGDYYPQEPPPEEFNGVFNGYSENRWVGQYQDEAYSEAPLYGNYCPYQQQEWQPQVEDEETRREVEDLNERLGSMETTIKRMEQLLMSMVQNADNGVSSNSFAGDTEIETEENCKAITPTSMYQSWTSASQEWEFSANNDSEDEAHILAGQTINAAIEQKVDTRAMFHYDEVVPPPQFNSPCDVSISTLPMVEAYEDDFSIQEEEEDVNCFGLLEEHEKLINGNPGMQQQILDDDDIIHISEGTSNQGTPHEDKLHEPTTTMFALESFSLTQEKEVLDKGGNHARIMTTPSVEYVEFLLPPRWNERKENHKFMEVSPYQHLNQEFKWLPQRFIHPIDVVYETAEVYNARMKAFHTLVELSMTQSSYRP